MTRRTGIVVWDSGFGLSAAAAAAAIRSAAASLPDGGDEPRWPGQSHREPGRTPKKRDWEFRDRKGRPGR